MRKISFLSLSVFCILLFGCNNAGNDTSEAKSNDSMKEKNLAAFQVVTHAFETGDASKIDSVVAPDFVDHGDHGDQGRDSLKAMVVSMHSQMPDMKTEVVKTLADDEYVFGLMRYSGTSKGQMGMPVGPYDMKMIEVVKFKDGKAVEHWAYMDPKDMMKMMGPQADTTKKKK